MAPAWPDDTFYARLKAALLARGVTRDAWARCVRWLRSPGHGLAPIGGTPVAVGRFVLLAWRRERRVAADRVAALATAIAASLPGETDDFGVLTCWRGHDPGPLVPAVRAPQRLATCRSTVDLLRHHLEDDPAGVLARPEHLAGLEQRYRRTDDADQQREMALWIRPLGKRASPPARCGPLPHAERFDLVWAFPWQPAHARRSADQLRDLLGLVTLGKESQMVAFHYPRDQAGEVAVPTVVEALGGWAFVPAQPGNSQTTYDYRTLRPGVQELVHAARVPPGACRFTWLGELTREWHG